MCCKAGHYWWSVFFVSITMYQEIEKNTQNNNYQNNPPAKQ